MTDTTIKEPVVTKIFESFRYDLLKAVIFIFIFTAIIIYANSESGKYYPEKRGRNTLLQK